MEYLIKNMEFSVKHWAPFPRQFPSAMPVIQITTLMAKDHWVRTTFAECNFSIILRGRGEYLRHGRRWKVEAPCVITQWPGEYLEYGPFLPEETWDEVALVYHASLVPYFRHCGFVQPDRPVWATENPHPVRKLIEELRISGEARASETVVDRVDRICERIILETLLSQHGRPEGDAAFEAAVSEVRHNLGTPIDFEALASRHGMSLSTLRRRWIQALGVPPVQSLQDFRMREACRLLAETWLSIKEIAHSLGYVDELYFSKRFRCSQGLPPSAYRRAYRGRKMSLK